MANERRTPPELPIDEQGEVIQTTPVATALARTVKALTSSFLITLNASTKIVRIYAISKDIYLKWADTDVDYVKATNFDEIIPAGQIIDFGIPDQPNGVKYSRIMLVGREAGSTVVVVEK